MAGLIRRGKYYTAVFRVGGLEIRRALGTDSCQVAKEKLRQLETEMAQGSLNPLPGKTPVGEIITAYVDHLRATKTAKSAQVSIYYLRKMFGVVCPALTVTSRRVTAACMKRPPLAAAGRARREPVIPANYIEEVTTARISDFIHRRVRDQGLAPKTANRYREVITRLINWAMKERGLRMPMNLNPGAAVARYRERAPRIVFLTLAQIEAQLGALESRPQLRAMVAMYIYAGLRREELLWLQLGDVDLNAGQHGMIRVQAKEVDGDRWQSKTAVNRTVPISRALRQILDGYQPRVVPGNWYFPSPQGNRYDPDNFSSELRTAQKAAGQKWTCLHFRHTFGSQLAQKGESLYKISTLMGNSPEICRRHYAALIPEAMVDTVEFPDAKPTKQPRIMPALRLA